MWISQNTVLDSHVTVSWWNSLMFLVFLMALLTITKSPTLSLHRPTLKRCWPHLTFIHKPKKNISPSAELLFLQNHTICLKHFLGHYLDQKTLRLLQSVEQTSAFKYPLLKVLSKQMNKWSKKKKKELTCMICFLPFGHVSVHLWV